MSVDHLTTPFSMWISSGTGAGGSTTPPFLAHPATAIAHTTARTVRQRPNNARVRTSMLFQPFPEGGDSNRTSETAAHAEDQLQDAVLDLRVAVGRRERGAAHRERGVEQEILPARLPVVQARDIQPQLADLV